MKALQGISVWPFVVFDIINLLHKILIRLLYNDLKKVFVLLH